MFAHVTAGTVDAVGQPPNLIFHDGRWWDLRTRDLPTLAVVGWFPVLEAVRPPDTTLTTWEALYTANGGDAVVQSWVEVPKSQERIDAEAARAAHEAQRAVVKQIVTDLQAEKARAQLVIDKTNAQITGSDTKDVARAAKRIADAAIDLARFVQDN